MNPTILGVIGPGFLNQVPTLGFRAWDSQFLGPLWVWPRGFLASCFVSNLQGSSFCVSLVS